MNSDIAKRLIKVQDEYISFLTRCLSGSSIFMSIHGMSASEDDIKKGRELRYKIRRLKIDANIT